MSGVGGSNSESGGFGNESRSSVSGGLNKKVQKNASGNMTDLGWKYGVAVDGTRKIMCNYCKDVISGGIYRFKHHLAGTRLDCKACNSVPSEVQTEIWGILVALQENKRSKDCVGGSSNMDEHIEVGDERQKRQAVENPSDLFKRKGVSQQSTINTIFKKNLREEACQEIASFFYNNAIPFNVARSDEFMKMFDLVARHGPGFKPPSYHEIRVKYLKQNVDSITGEIEEHRAYWRKIGCSIMTDGWTDRKRRTILNFLVNSPKGTVFLKSIDASHISKTADKVFKMMDDIVVDVGEENVIQVVTDNAANYKVAGEMLMKKRNRLYWTPCAAHCIDLMLEDYEKKIPIHKETIVQGKKITTYIYGRTALICLLHQFTKGGDLVRPAITRFATSYLTLGCLHDKKGELVRMFTSNEWKSSSFSKSKDEKLVENLVMDREFWKKIVICLRGAYPLIKVLRMVDSDEKPAMGFIYEAMSQAKENIKSAFNGVSRSYMPIWEIIDARWDKQLHRPLHSAGYYLNPKFHYSPDFKADFEVKRGLYDCLERLVGNTEEVSKIDGQLETFKSKSGFFSSKVAVAGIQTKTPAQWWESYGDETPELQNFAIRVLSLTCSSSGCERNWSAFEMVHTKRRNCLKQKTMNDVVYVMANSKLAKKKQVKKEKEYVMDDLSSDDDWLVDSDLDLDVENEELIQNVEVTISGVGGASRDDLEILSLDDELNDDGNGANNGQDGDNMNDDDPDVAANNLNDLL